MPLARIKIKWLIAMSVFSPVCKPKSDMIQTGDRIQLINIIQVLLLMCSPYKHKMLEIWRWSCIILNWVEMKTIWYVFILNPSSSQQMELGVIHFALGSWHSGTLCSNHQTITSSSCQQTTLVWWWSFRFKHQWNTNTNHSNSTGNPEIVTEKVEVIKIMGCVSCPFTSHILISWTYIV